MSDLIFYDLSCSVVQGGSDDEIDAYVEDNHEVLGGRRDGKKSSKSRK